MGQLLRDFVKDLTRDENAPVKKKKPITDVVIYNLKLKGKLKIYLNYFENFSVDFINESNDGLSLEFDMYDDNYTTIYDIRKSDIGEVICKNELKVTVIADDLKFGIGSISINIVPDTGEKYCIVIRSSSANNKILNKPIKNMQLMDEVDYQVFGYFPDFYDYTGLPIPERK